jgi:SAM-dependent methyltransferase
MTENELSVAAFYCRLFAERGPTTSDSKSAEKEEAGDSNVARRNFWVQDTWTDSDVRSAEALLQDHLEKCSVSALDRDDGMDDGDAWNRFYSNHGTRFFKDRHYLERDFSEDFAKGGAGSNDDNNNNNKNKNKTLVEIGCGVGNTILPMLEEQENDDETNQNQHPTLQLGIVHGLDISKEAIDLMKQDPRFVKANADQRAYGHVCDIVYAAPPACIGSADIATLLFCLSAIDPDAMPNAALHVASILKPGGVLLFRDYGRFDEAQLKLGMSRNKRLKNNFYRKHDGTKCFYFTLKDLEKLFKGVGLEVLELTYLQRVYDNIKSGEKRRRVWVHARFLKPS